jgi:hypothetical protein
LLVGAVSNDKSAHKNYCTKKYKKTKWLNRIEQVTLNESSKALSSTMPRTVKQKEQNPYNLGILKDLNKTKKLELLIVKRLSQTKILWY